jgi:predicted ArsR family transcriptional regulator
VSALTRLQAAAEAALQASAKPGRKITLQLDTYGLIVSGKQAVDRGRPRTLSASLRVSTRRLENKDSNFAIAAVDAVGEALDKIVEARRALDSD